MEAGVKCPERSARLLPHAAPCEMDSRWPLGTLSRLECITAVLLLVREGREILQLNLLPPPQTFC